MYCDSPETNIIGEYHKNRKEIWKKFYEMYLYLAMKSRNLLLYKWTTGIYRNDYNKMLNV